MAVERNVVLVDMDGTLANVSHRLHWVRGGKKNWNKFFREMHKDPPYPVVLYGVETWHLNIELSP
jgi:hypothetical protein